MKKKNKSRKTGIEISAMKEFSTMKKEEFELMLKNLQEGEERNEEDYRKRGIGVRTGYGLNPFGE